MSMLQLLLCQTCYTCYRAKHVDKLLGLEGSQVTHMLHRQLLNHTLAHLASAPRHTMVHVVSLEANAAYGLSTGAVCTHSALDCSAHASLNILGINCTFLAWHVTACLVIEGCVISPLLKHAVSHTDRAAMIHA